MEWQIKTIARKSSISEQAFEPGDEVVCLIFKDDQAGELGRADLYASEVDQFQLPGQLLGRWSRIIKDPDDERAHAGDIMASAEDFFLSLYENQQTDAEDEANALKHLLALMLERKRILRAVGARATTGMQRYLHVKQKKELDVPVVDISPDLIIKIQDTLGDIIL